MKAIVYNAPRDYELNEHRMRIISQRIERFLRNRRKLLRIRRRHHDRLRSCYNYFHGNDTYGLCCALLSIRRN